MDLVLGLGIDVFGCRIIDACARLSCFSLLVEKIEIRIRLV